MGKNRPKKRQTPADARTINAQSLAADLYQQGILTRLQAFGHYTGPAYEDIVKRANRGWVK